MVEDRAARFRDKVVVVLGGSSGIGRASVLAFVAEGAAVVATGRNATALAEVAAEAGERCTTEVSDITDLHATEALLQRVGERYGRIDVLFVNAGTGAFVPIEAVTPTFYDDLMAVNLRGPYFAVKAALPWLRAGSSVILTASIGHRKGLPGNSVYAASKAGLRALARNFGVELVGRGIRVNSFSPGPIDTPLIERGGMSAAQVAEAKENIRRAVPMQRWGAPEEAARTVLFLASEDSSFVTGIDLLVDGGLTSF